MKLRKTILTALFAALTCVATLVITIPSPTGGFFNLGDCIVILSAVILGPVYGMLAAGIGSGLADILAGFATYAPATLVIKALMGLAVGTIYQAFAKSGRHFGHSIAGAAVGGVAAEIIMVLGYFLYETVLYGAPAAFGNVLTTNLPQAAVGLVGGLALFTVLDRTKLTTKLAGGLHHVA